MGSGTKSPSFFAALLPECPAFLRILAKSERYKLRYDAAKQEIPRVEVV